MRHKAQPMQNLVVELKSESIFMVHAESIHDQVFMIGAEPTREEAEKFLEKWSAPRTGNRYWKHENGKLCITITEKKVREPAKV